MFYRKTAETYFRTYPGKYFTGDGARRDEDGYYWITGRVDDVINVAGHRIGTAEVESALVSHQKVAEAAVVGRPDAMKGQARRPAPDHDVSMKDADSSRPIRPLIASEKAGILKARSAFPREDVDLYLRTLAALDGDTWAELDGALAERPSDVDLLLRRAALLRQYAR